MSGALVREPEPAQPGAAPRWYAHDWNHPAVYRAIAATASALPRGVRHRAAALIADVAARRFPAERGAVLRNLAHVMPAATPAELTGLAREVFRHFAICLVDLVTANRTANIERLVGSMSGADRLEATLRQGRGAIVVTAHFGNWELAGRLLAAQSARPTHVVVAAEADPRLEQYLRGGAAQVRFVARTKPTIGLELYAALRRGEIVAVQGDRALRDRTDVLAPFFGETAPFASGPFALARAAGAALVPAFCALEPDRRYAITVGEPIVVQGRDETAALLAWVRTLEAAVRRHPTQWFNFFDVWEPASV